MRMYLVFHMPFELIAAELYPSRHMEMLKIGYIDFRQGYVTQEAGGRMEQLSHVRLSICLPVRPLVCASINTQ